MGMSTHCVGFRPPDEQWSKMKAAWESCEAAGIPVPSEVEEFFAFDPPGDKPGQEIELGDAVSEYSCEDGSGYEVDVAELPPNITIIRFINSW